MATLDDGSSAVFVISGSRFADSNANPQMTAQQHAGLLRRLTQGELQAYLAEARRKAKIVKNEKVFTDQ